MDLQTKFRFSYTLMIKRIFFTLFLPVAFFGCSSTKVVMDYDKNAPFESYKTYNFLPWSEQNSKMINQLDQDRLYDGCRVEMNKRGFTEVKDNPDVYVNLIVIINKESGVTAYTDYYSPYGYYYGYGYGHSTTRYSEYDYLKGSLIVDIFDAQQKKLVWQGTAISELDDGPSSPEKREANISTFFKKIFAYYPVKPKK